eukprot:CAMPEP_0181209410 /NCGR_PEP_ID=MMETSP1096-20121128/22654_1 /TAXON_ID=156174 ORGANISM="Chrysochromulina ericina, Strain CCMP281" /NCGR_SAMPLE_ID=MMETSP1096 /ASSEMBLY_ACC=CAM_ASM_000453 /LENGTH=74 /DNA_ID=CAMNT_0023300575 /DNA_START=527 /DNA_END=751 /DNA_ORIENTATION=+
MAVVPLKGGPAHRACACARTDASEAPAAAACGTSNAAAAWQMGLHLNFLEADAANHHRGVVRTCGFTRHHHSDA